MSVSLVRKALEISSADSGLTAISKKNKFSKKEKLAERKKKKSTPNAIQKKNLKYLKSLDSFKPKLKKAQDKVQQPLQNSSKKKKNKKEPVDDPNKTAFTDEDFAKFEQEYFVS